MTLSEPLSARLQTPSKLLVGRTLLAGAALMLCLQAQALTLGRLQVFSAIGEPLRAEVELQDFNPLDATALRLLALPATAYSALGQQNNALAAAFEVTLVSGPGAPRLLLSSRQVMDAPFVDFVIEASWPAGRSVREYTALFNEKPAATPSSSAQVVPAVSSPELASSGAQNTSPSSNAGTPNATTENRSHVVKTGETAGKIAQAHASPDTTLEQMLLALLRENPQAFMGGNVNQLRAGSVLQIPSNAAAQSVAPKEARQLIELQHRAFETLRQRIAQTAPAREVPSASRESAGQVVTAPPPTASAPAADKLTLSKSEVSAKDTQAPQEKEAALDKLAKDLQTREVESGNRKLTGQLDELQKLSDQAAATAKAAPSSDPTTTTDPTTPSAPASADATPAAQATDENSGTAAKSEAASGLSSEAVNPNAEKHLPSTLIDQLIGMPWIPGLAAGLLAALAGLAAYRVRQRRKQVALMDEPAQETLAAAAQTPAWQAPVQEEDPSTAPLSPLPSLDMPASAQALMANLPDLNLPALDGDPPSAGNETPTPQAAPEVQDLSDDEPLAETVTASPAAPQALSLNLEGLSLDLDVPDLSDKLPDLSAAPSADDAMAKKLDLAKEFVAMGDKEGARALIDEVMAHSSGELRAQAESMLFELA